MHFLKYLSNMSLDYLYAKLMNNAPIIKYNSKVEFEIESIKKVENSNNEYIATIVIKDKEDNKCVKKIKYQLAKNQL